MASFSQAHARSMEKEGGYSNHPNDKGGETIFGIARNHHPNWGGWSLVDGCKMFIDIDIKEGSRTWCDELTNLCKSNADIVKLKNDFYQKNFWDKFKLGQINSQKVADSIYDMVINHGEKNAIKILQRALLFSGKEVDGIFGKNTLSAVLASSESSLLRSIKQERRSFYYKIVEKNPDQKVFLNGWLARADSYA